MSDENYIPIQTIATDPENKNQPVAIKKLDDKLYAYMTLALLLETYLDKIGAEHKKIHQYTPLEEARIKAREHLEQFQLPSQQES